MEIPWVGDILNASTESETEKAVGGDLLGENIGSEVSPIVDNTPRPGGDIVTG